MRLNNVFATIRSQIASALISLENALRQPFHSDTAEREALSALVAMRGSFKLIIVKNSLALNRRIAQMRAQWLQAGRPVPEGIPKSGLKTEVWFDQACYAQLRREGWGLQGSGDKQLELFTVLVEERNAIVFSTWLFHAGHEFSEGDLELFNRIHYYLVWWPIIGEFKTTNNHTGMVEDEGLNFSAGLHFFPRPSPRGPPMPCKLPRVVD